MEPINNYKSFNARINASDTAVVKFVADWCPDCAVMDAFLAPILEEFRYIDWYTVNRDEVTEADGEYDVPGVPSLFIFKKGELLARLPSARTQTPGEVRSFLLRNL